MVQTTGAAGESIAAGISFMLLVCLRLGGVLRSIVAWGPAPEERDGPRADSGPGVLIASGQIAGSATGVVLAALQPQGLDAAFDLSMPAGSRSLAMMTNVALLAIPVYAVARSRRSP